MQRREGPEDSPHDMSLLTVSCFTRRQQLPL